MDGPSTSLCLLCLRGLDLISPKRPPSPGSSSSSRTKPSTTSNVVGLCHLVKHPKLENSIPHQNIIHEHDGDTCSLCQDCISLCDAALSIQEQISQLQTQLRTKVTLIRNRILESDAQRWKTIEEGEACDDYGRNEFDRLLPIRQSLLRLSDEDDTILSGDVQVKVKIETEEDNEFPVDEFSDACSPSAFLLHPDEGCVKEEDIDELFITPRNKPRSSEKRKKTDYTRTQSNDAEVPKKKRGRPRMTQKPAPPKKHPATKKHKSPMKILSDTSSCSEVDTESEYENENLEDSDSLDGLMSEDWAENKAGGDADKMKPFKCENCARSFTSEERLKKHTQKFHKFGCHICTETFKTSGDRINHEKSEHKGVAPFRCTICSRKFCRKGGLQVHMVVRHETTDKPHICSKCDKAFTLELNLERHLELHKVERERPLVCEVCDSRFADSARLEKHSGTHNKSFLCNYCNKSYSSRTGLARHQRRHTNEKPFKCDHCEETFIDKAAKQWHTSKLHTDASEYHLCNICGKSFFSVYILKAHLDRHAGKQNVTCEACGEKFSDYSSLSTHRIRKHDGEPLICDECGAKFMTGKGLQSHKMSHAGLKPFKCDVCDARFLSKWVLDNHIRAHTGERPFVCEHCGKGFKAKKHVDAHVKSIHSENYVLKTPHVCSYCGKEYPRKGILDGHIRQVHTGERPFVCQVCSKGFALNTTLTLHLKSHGINVSTRKGERLPRSKRESISSPTTQSSGVGKKRGRSLAVTSSSGVPSNRSSTIDQSQDHSISSSDSLPHNLALTSNAKFPLVNNFMSSVSSHNHYNGNLPGPSSLFFGNNPSLSHNYYQL